MFAETFARDVRVGLRVLVKERSFCALAILVLALGICGVATMFAVVNGVLIRGFSFPNANRLVHVAFTDPTIGNPLDGESHISSMDFRDLAAEQRSFSAIASYVGGETVNVTIDGSPRRFDGTYATEQFLGILGVQPMLGRDFTAADNRPGAERVAIIAYSLWQRDFGGTADIIGKSVRMNGKPTTIVGVMPKGFGFPYKEELWIPLYSEFPIRPRNDAQDLPALVVGLMKPGVSVERANAEVTGLAKRFAQAYPATNKQLTSAIIVPLIRVYTPQQLGGTLLTMLAFCVGVLLIACVNVMNMQFARATLRAKELAVRSSLGATRSRLVAQMLTESLIVAVLGAVIGVALAYYAVDWLWVTVHNMQSGPPTWMTFDMDKSVLALTVAATIGAAVLSGLLPAWMASRGNAAIVLRDGSRGSTGHGVSLVTRGLVVLQIVVTCVLLVGSLLQVRSILNQQNIDFGYDTTAQLSARVGLMEGDYPTPESRKLFYDRLLTTLRSAPDFQAAALTNRNRMVYSGTARIEIEGRVYKDKRDRPNANFEQVSQGFSDVIQQKVLQGRAFADDDVDSKLPVALVNAAFARKHFGSESPIGRRFRTIVESSEEPGPWRTIIGVVANVRMIGPYNNPTVDDSGFYLPFYSSVFGAVRPAPLPNQFATVVVRPRAGQRAETMGAALRREIDKVDRNLPLYYVGTTREHIDRALAQNRVIVGMFSTFGIVAVVLASVGLYGLMSFSVNQRRQEFGVRMALGADRRAVMKIVMKQGGRQLVVGLVLGFGLTVALAGIGRNVLANMLYNVSPRDPLTYAIVFAIVTVVALVAIVVPGRRASRVDPMVALRAD